MKTKRKFIAIYFPHVDDRGRRLTKNIAIAFGPKELKLYEKASAYTSTEIKRMFKIFSYNQLLEVSGSVNRKPSELIKLRLKERLLDKDQVGKKIRKWVKYLQAEKNCQAKYGDLIEYLEDRSY